MVSTSSTQIDIQTPLSAVSSPSGPNVAFTPPLPRPPCAPSQRKISHFPERTHPNVGGSPQSQIFSQPSFANHAKLSPRLATLRIGVSPCASIGKPSGSLRQSDHGIDARRPPGRAEAGNERGDGEHAGAG